MIVEALTEPGFRKYPDFRWEVKVRPGLWNQSRSRSANSLESRKQSRLFVFSYCTEKN